MASGPCSRVEEQAPALPVKQHRRSSMESDCSLLSPVHIQHQNYPCNDVFQEPTDCHAAQCPIHQRYDPSRHQVRFFSDSLTPPPVPKKRISRTLSLPATDAPPLSPLPKLQRQPQSFDNPLYMLAPLSGASCFHEEAETFQPVRESPVPSVSLSQLSFDTPDEHLPYLFSSFDDHQVVFQGIQRRHLLFLRSVAQSVEAEILLPAEATEGEGSAISPQDFLLSEGCGPTQIGDAFYYRLISPKLPGRVLGLRVHKQTDPRPSAQTRHQPSHVNVRHVIACFQPSSVLRDEYGTRQSRGPPRPSEPGVTVAQPPGGGSAERAAPVLHLNLPSVQSFLVGGHSVSVERDPPHATLEDFIRESGSLQSTDCLAYDRQVCVLLLQILMGSQHLYNSSSSAAELRPREIFLVWPNRERGARDNKPDASETETSRPEEDWETMEEKGQIQMLWKTYGSPRVVLTPPPLAPSVHHPITFIKSQIGALIQYCLTQQEGPASLGSSSVQSSYRMGLLHVASELQSEGGDGGGRQMADAVAMLQVLLWGPRLPPSQHSDHLPTTAVHNWLTIKRALLVMKLAERGLIQDQSALDWEICMCLQYLSFTDPETVLSVTGQLWPTLKMD